MGNMTVRRIDDEVIRDLRISAAKRGVSMEQEARDRLRQPLRTAHEQVHETGEKLRWRLKASKEEILALGRRAAIPVDHKAESDALYDYLQEE